MSRRVNKLDEDVLEYRIIVSLIIIAIAAIMVIAYIWISNSVKSKANLEEEISNISNEKMQIANQESVDENTESASSSIGKTITESSENKNEENEENEENEKININNSVNETSTNDTVSTNNENTTEETKTTEEAEENNQPIFAMPVEGEIIKGFSIDNLVFSETLQEWVTHLALDIKANSRDVVKAAGDGTVKAIKNDPRYGLTVIIEHSAGFETVYSNLLTAEFVVEGEEVKMGQTIGTVGSSAVFEIADESHLHFEMLLNSEYVDPSLYINN